MDAQQIDKLFEELKNNNDEYILGFADIQGDISEEDRFNEELFKKALHNMYKELRKGDYEYFLEKLKSDDRDTVISCIVILACSQDNDEIKSIIERREEYNIDRFSIMKLIAETKDSEFIDKYIEKRKELKFEKYEILELISAIEDPKFKIKYIQRKEEFGINDGNLYDLFRDIKNPEYIEEYIERREEFGLEGRVDSLIIQAHDKRLIDKCIEKRQELCLLSFDLPEIITSSKDPEFIKKYIKRRREFNFGEDDLEILIAATKDSKYIFECIENEYYYGLSSKNIRTLAYQIKDSKYRKKCVERYGEFGFDTDDLLILIQGIKDSEYIYKCCIEGREEYGFKDVDIRNLARKIKDPIYLKKCIENRQELGLNLNDILHLIIKTKDKEYIESFVNTGKEEFGFDDKDINKLALVSGKTDYINSLIQEGAQINLPTNMTIGMEIESIGEESQWIKNKKNIDNWKCKNDASLKSDKPFETGVEVISPILTGDNNESTKQIRKICTILDTFGQYTNETCGGHIHIGANYLTNIQAWQNLVELWANTEQVLYIVSNEKGIIPRDGVPHYASPISGDLEELLNSGSINLEDETDLKKFQEKLVKAQEDRYKGINFKNLERGGKGTIEFRLPNGTVDANTWIENINLFGGLVKSAQGLAIIQEKNESERTEQEQHLLECFEKIRNKEVDEKETLEQLLEIVVPEENREVYIERYETNSELLKKSPKIDKGIREKTAKKSVKISKNKIGKEIFTGADRITGEDYKEANQAMLAELESLLDSLSIE